MQFTGPGWLPLFDDRVHRFRGGANQDLVRLAGRGLLSTGIEREAQIVSSANQQADVLIE